ncbi:MAG: SH3 domain-containing protein [Oscillospiraceae bacterium]|nr:SH3 domain-containing protein [Oscillospiraceae bacterium]
MTFRLKSLNQYLSLFLAMVLLFVCASLPGQAALAAGTKIGKVINVSSSVNVRSDANTSSGIVASLPAATIVTVLGEKAGTSVTDNGKTSSTWYQIKTSGGATGYINSLYLEVTTDYTGWVGTVINVTSSLNVRAEANTSSSVLATLSPGATVTLLGELQGSLVSGSALWYKIKTAGGVTGYVSSYYLSVKEGTADTTLATPVLTSVTNTTAGVTVSWKAVSGAAKYRVFYKTSGSSWTKAADTTGTSYTVTGLTSGTSYTFTVRCLDASGNYASQYDTTGLTITYTASSTPGTTTDFQSVLNQFPESYWPGLLALHKLYPNWVFRPLTVSLDWDYTISKEVQDNYSLTSLVEAPTWTAVPSSYKCCESYAFNWSTGQWIPKDNGSLVCASRELIEYYMDPRNFMDTTYIFQFLEMSFDASTQTVAGVQAILNGSFMAGDLPDEPGTSYAQCIYNASKIYGANPYVIAAKLLGEQGRNGSALTSGTYAGYEGYYNYFNYNAYGNGSAAIITNGLSYAKKQGWDTHRKSIEGGTAKYVSGYIAGGQSTPYLTRFDVLGSRPFTHQYASDICYAWSEASKISKIYTSDIREQSLTFTLPVYQSMPESACSKPSGDSSPYLKLKSLTASAGSLSPRFQPEITSYTLTLPAGSTSANLIATGMDDSATVSGGGTVSVGSVAAITVTSRYGETKSYTVRVISSALDTSSSSLTLEGGMAIATKGATANAIISKAGGSSSAKIWSGGKEKTGSSLVATGDALVYYDHSGASLGAFSLVVPDDVNGDAKMDIKDVSALFRACTTQESLTDAQLRAAEIEGNPTLRDVYLFFKKL